MPEMFAEMPFVVLYFAMLVIGFTRGHLTYSLAKFATEKAIAAPDSSRPMLAKLQRWLASPATESGIKIIHRFGLVAVPLCYLTVGLQTVVLAAAGVVRIPRLKFALAQLPGAACWAAIYSTVGWAAWEALLGRAASRYGLLLVGAVVVALLIGWLVRRRLQRAAGV